MTSPTPLPRSPELLSPGDSGLLVVDVQEKLVRLIDGYRRIVWNIRRLLDGAKLLGVPVAATEQYPEKLGGTVAELAQRLGTIHPKLAFSCGGCPQAIAELVSRGVHKVLVAGIETHVCVQQTVLDLLAEGHRVYVAADATGSRFPVDREYALRRMESCGATLTTTEAALFEWCGAAGTPQFKAISALVKEPAPAD
jgi:nicotinamidase-related amidase